MSFPLYYLVCAGWAALPGFLLLFCGLIASGKPGAGTWARRLFLAAPYFFLCAVSLLSAAFVFVLARGQSWFYWYA